jgi:flagellar biosynthesis anti-sigma factor FlgM
MMKIQYGPADKARKAQSATVAGEKSGKAGVQRNGGAAVSRQSDRVVLSERLGSLAESIREISRVDAPMGASEARLEELKAAIEAGDYHVDPRKLAASILNSDLGIEE